jgi:hypothetical protein
MQINIFEELLWPQFIRIEKYSKLPLNEQVAAYQQYVYDLSAARQNWLNYQNKGPFAFSGSVTPPPIESGFLLQEDLFNLLQEDGSNIIITTLP